jgi:hypothetical protein
VRSDPVRVDAESTPWVDLIAPDSGEVRVRIAEGGRLGGRFSRGVFAHGDASASNPAGAMPIPASPRGDQFVFESLALGRYRVGVGHAKSEPGPSAVDVELIEPGQIIEIELRVPEAMAIGGSVVDASGVPVPDAWVKASFAEAGAPLLQVASEPALTGADGRFEIIDLLPGLYALVATHASGEAQALEVRAGQRDVRLAIEAPGSLSGHVTGTDRQPVQSFRVLALGATPSEPLSVTGDRGRWSLPWIAPGEYRVVFMSPSGGASVNVRVNSGSETVLETSLDPALAGDRVMNALTHR